MPEIKFDERTLEKVKQGMGIYGRRKIAQTVITEPGFIAELRIQLLKTIETAFREYAKEHKGCTLKIENEAWKRFERRLKRRL